MKIISQKQRKPITTNYSFDMDDEMKPGLYNISNDEYHSSEGLSNSGISKLLDCPQKYWYEYLNENKPKEEKDSRALIVGQAVHTMSLEPDEFNNRFAVHSLELPELVKPALLKDLVAEFGKDDGRKYFEEGKSQYEHDKGLQDQIRAEYAASCEGKTMLSKVEFEKVQGMAASIRSNKAFMKLIDDKNKYVEHSIYFEDPATGVLLKSRPDFFNTFMGLDLKTTISAKEEDFMKAIFNYGYHRQAALGLDALTALTGCQYDSWVILAVEKEAPYLTALYVLDQHSIELGRREYQAAVKTFKECQQTNQWRGYSEQVIQVSLPQWAFNKQL